MKTSELLDLLKECREKKRKASGDELRFLSECYKAIHTLILTQAKLRHTRKGLIKIQQDMIV